MKRLTLILLGCLCFVSSAAAQIILSGNESKIDLSNGDPRVVPDAETGSISILDFSSFPPRVQHLPGISNSVIGPPSNIAVTPNGELALIADSIQLDHDSESGWIPDSRIHILDLTGQPPKIVGQVRAGRQPSGMSITPDGRLALVANRADGTVSVIRIRGKRAQTVQTVKVCEPEEEASDVAVSPDGKLALVSVRKGSCLQLLRIENDGLIVDGAKFSVYGQPYRVVISPDGRHGLTAGAGFGQAIDADALSVVDLKADPPRTVDYIPIASVPESIEISPDGELIAVVSMAGSNLAADDPNRTEQGELNLLARAGRSFERVQTVKIGRVPEGAAFTSDGKYLAVQCHVAKEIWIFRVEGRRVTDTGVRVATPGYPSSMRAGP